MLGRSGPVHQAKSSFFSLHFRLLHLPSLSPTFCCPGLATVPCQKLALRYIQCGFAYQKMPARSRKLRSDNFHLDPGGPSHEPLDGLDESISIAVFHPSGQDFLVQLGGEDRLAVLDSGHPSELDRASLDRSTVPRLFGFPNVTRRSPTWLHPNPNSYRVRVEYFRFASRFYRSPSYVHLQDRYTLKPSTLNVCIISTVNAFSSQLCLLSAPDCR